MANPAANGAAAAPVSSCTVESMFSRRIDFHPARKPYSHGSGGNFQLETLNPGADSWKPTSSSGGSAAALAPSIGKKSDGGEFYEHGLDPELGFRITFRRIGAGLLNLGNTCFLNSVVQCLTYTEPFAAYLQSGKHKSSCHTPGFCAMCALQNHVMNALQSTGKILSPMHLVKNLRCISRNFRNSRQEDAHEYMVNLLESMHRCCLPSGIPSESPRAFEKSLVHKIFGGQLRSQVKCIQCSYCSNKFDPFLDLSLEIVKADSLRKALSHFTAVEQLDGGEKQYHCQHCKEKVRALKQLTIHKPPYVLTVHLKRFSAANPGQKINRKVEFEPTLDLKPFVSDRHEGSLKYTLYGVLVHAGWSTHSGHYYCFVRTSSGMWHSLDDNEVFQVSEKTVLAQKAYMLFYVRDRTQSVKRSADASPRDNMPTNGLGNKSISQSVSSSSGDPFSISDNSAKHPGRNEASLQNGKTMPLATQNLQNNNHVSQMDATMLQSKGDLSKVSQETNPKILKENGTYENDSVANSIAQKNIAVFKMENNNVSSKIEAIKVSSQQENLNTVLVEHQDAGFKDKCLSKYQSQNDSQNLLKVDESLSTNLSKNPITTGIQMVAVQETNGSDVLKEVLKVSDIDCSVSTSFHTQLNQKKLAKCSRVRSEYLGRSKVFLASLSLQKNKKHKRRRKQGASSKHIKDESLQDHDLGMSTSEAAGVAAEDSKCASLRKNKKHKRHGKQGASSKHIKDESLQDHDLGMSTSEAAGVAAEDSKCASLRKNKKHKRCRNQGASSKHVKDESLQDHYLGMSTSEAAGVAAEDSKCAPKKQSNSLLNSETNSHELKDANHHQLDCVNLEDRETQKNSRIDVASVTFQHLNSGSGSASNLHDAPEMSTHGKGQNHRILLNLLMRGLKETTVPKWDETELPSSEMHGNGQIGSIGYVLDEWDEEYDQGRRKKVKRSKASFSGPNLFQETANMKAQHKIKTRMDPTSSGNLPYRI